MSSGDQCVDFIWEFVIRGLVTSYRGPELELDSHLKQTIKPASTSKVIRKEKSNSGTEHKKYFYYKKRKRSNKDPRKPVNAGCKLRHTAS